MQKIITLSFSFLLLFLKVSLLCAQTPEATFITGNEMKKSEIIRLQIKDDLKLMDAKFDSVAIIQKDFQTKYRRIRFDRKLTEILKQKYLIELSEARTKRLKSAGLYDAEVKKVETYFLYHQFPY